MRGHPGPPVASGIPLDPQAKGLLHDHQSYQDAVNVIPRTIFEDVPARKELELPLIMWLWAITVQIASVPIMMSFGLAPLAAPHELHISQILQGFPPKSGD